MPFTHTDQAKPFGWQGEKKTHGWTPLARASESSLGNMDPGRIKDFIAGVDAAHDKNAKIALAAVGTYAGLKAYSYWRSTRPGKPQNQTYGRH